MSRVSVIAKLTTSQFNCNYCNHKLQCVVVDDMFIDRICECCYYNIGCDDAECDWCNERNIYNINPRVRVLTQHVFEPVLVTNDKKICDFTCVICRNITSTTAMQFYLNKFRCTGCMITHIDRTTEINYDLLDTSEQHSCDNYFAIKIFKKINHNQRQVVPPLRRVRRRLF